MTTKLFYKKISACLLTFIVLMSVVFSGMQGVNAASRIRINKKKISTCVGKKIHLKVLGTKKKVKWKSSNTLVATVSKKGVVKTSDPGKVVITARVAGKALECHINVKEKKQSSLPGTSPMDSAGPSIVPAETSTAASSQDSTSTGIPSQNPVSTENTTINPAVKPTVAPIIEPTTASTGKLTDVLTIVPTTASTTVPTGKPVATSIAAPTAAPAGKPTATSIAAPTAASIAAPTTAPAGKPMATSIVAPTGASIVVPTGKSIAAPTATPTVDDKLSANFDILKNKMIEYGKQGNVNFSNNPVYSKRDHSNLSDGTAIYYYGGIEYNPTEGTISFIFFIDNTSSAFDQDNDDIEMAKVIIQEDTPSVAQVECSYNHASGNNDVVAEAKLTTTTDLIKVYSDNDFDFPITITPSNYQKSSIVESSNRLMNSCLDGGCMYLDRELKTFVGLTFADLGFRN